MTRFRYKSGRIDYMRIALLGMLLLVSTADGASFLSGNDLYEQLKSSNIYERLRAGAYIEGVIDADAASRDNEFLAMAINGKLDKGKARFVNSHLCLGDTKVTLEQLDDIVLKHLMDNPDIRHMPANELVLGAMLHSFACAKNPT